VTDLQIDPQPLPGIAADTRACTNEPWACTNRGSGRLDGKGLLPFLNTTVNCVHLDYNGMGEGGGRALAETLRLNTTLASLDLSWNGLEEGGGRALAEALRLNTTLASLDLENTAQGEGEGRALAEALRLNTTLTWINLYHNDL
jgi:Ran GTPase-activating protein (RanGAP) involved in mRNA processing and transport